MTTVKTTLTRPDGSAGAFATCTIGVVGSGFTGTVGQQIRHEARVKSDANGLASVDLTPLGSDSYYVWNFPPGWGNPMPFTVPSSGGPCWLHDVVIGVPGYAGLLDVGMPKAVADGTYASGGGAARIITGPTLPTLAAGTEYVWNKTDGAGTLLDIISGVA